MFVNAFAWTIAEHFMKQSCRTVTNSLQSEGQQSHGPFACRLSVSLDLDRQAIFMRAAHGQCTHVVQLRWQWLHLCLYSRGLAGERPRSVVG